MTFIIGLHGPAGAGKDTVGGILQRDFGFRTAAYASTLKAMLAVVGLPEPSRELKNERTHQVGWNGLALDREQLEKMLKAAGWKYPGSKLAHDDLPGFDFSYFDAYGLLKHEWATTLKNMGNFSWRDAAQLLGTEWGRSLDHDLWVKITHRDVWAAVQEDPMTPWTITDVRFENEAAQIRRDSGFVLHIRGRADNMSEANVKHASEHGLTFGPGDHAVMNDSDLETLAQRVGAIVKGLPQ